MHQRLFDIELPYLEEVNRHARMEIGFKGTGGARIAPLLRNIHYWPARRPCSLARALTLAAILPKGVSHAEFRGLVGLGAAHKRMLYMVKPDVVGIEAACRAHLGRAPSEITVVDPMAGGGAIPLEAARMGFRTVAVEYNPLAYIILRATVEFPAKYARSGLFEATLREARKMIEWARSRLGRFYGEDAENYIFARGVRCPFCGGLVPLAGVGTTITKDEGFENRYLDIAFDKESKTFSVKTTSRKPEKEKWLRIAGKRGTISVECPYCGKFFAARGRGNTALARWFKRHYEVLEAVIEMYQPAEDFIDEIPLLHIPLVKQVGDRFLAAANDEKELSLLKEAFISLAEGVQQEDLGAYLPMDVIPVSNGWADPLRALGGRNNVKWYALFNPRQLFVLGSLTRYVAQRAEELHSSEGEFGAAVATYLAFALDKLADYNTIATLWHRSRAIMVHTLRGESTIDLRYEYCESKRIDLALNWTLEPEVAVSGKLTKTAGGILPVLKFLCDNFSSASSSKVEVYLGDATRLSQILGAGFADVINVDPPYFEQVVYSDRMEFFWVILRRALWPVLDALFPKERVKINWSPKGAGGSEFPREREVVVRGKTRNELSDRDEQVVRFKSLFKELASEFYKVLKDDRRLVLWFTHPSEIAWRCVGEALRDAGFVVTRVYPLFTEMPTRYKKQVNLVAQQITLAIVAEKARRELLSGIGEDVEGSLRSNSRFRSEGEKLAEHVLAVSRGTHLNTVDTFALTLGTAMSVATKFDLPLAVPFESIYRPAVSCVLSKFLGDVLREVLAETGFLKDILSVDEANTLVQRLSDLLLRDGATRAYVPLFLASRVDIATGQPYARFEKRPRVYGLDFDFTQTVSKLCGFDLVKLKEHGLIIEEKVARTKFYVPAGLGDLLALRSRIPESKLLATLPGLALLAAYTALEKAGTAEGRAKQVREELAKRVAGLKFSSSGITDIAALGLLILSLTSVEEVADILGKSALPIVGLSEAGQARAFAAGALKILAGLSSS
uniref:DUF1156 domain-containing protein n=1 Tax=Thermofilum pendens TaxID=2269 RepID=A0A7C4H7K8_THEPE